jgi:transcriptional repressor NrdR
VLESRDVEQESVIRRRRECLSCQHRFTTYERIEAAHLLIIKKNGERELFDRSKLAGGIYRAFEKRPVSADQIEAIISAVEQELKSTGEHEIASVTIGELVMDKLRESDDIAYVRFASVYRSFADIKSFEAELNRLKSQAKRKVD